jgi:predicted RNA-binding protein with RPS1 domain
MLTLDELLKYINPKTPPEMPDPLPHPLCIPWVKSRVFAIARSLACLTCALENAQKAVEAFQDECKDDKTPKIVEDSLRKFAVSNPSSAHRDFQASTRSSFITLHTQLLKDKVAECTSKRYNAFFEFLNDMETFFTDTGITPLTDWVATSNKQLMNMLGARYLTHRWDFAARHIAHEAAKKAKREKFEAARATKAAVSLEDQVASLTKTVKQLQAQLKRQEKSRKTSHPTPNPKTSRRKPKSSGNGKTTSQPKSRRRQGPARRN